MPSPSTLRRPRFCTSTISAPTFVLPLITTVSSHSTSLWHHRVAAPHFSAPSIITLPTACVSVASPTPLSPPSPSTSPSSLAISSAPEGPDIRAESLVLLDWPQISARVLHYASTSAGRALLSSTPTGLPIPSTRAESESLLSQTREVHYLEYQLHQPLSFSGVHDATTLVNLAEKGKILTGKELVAVAHTLAAARAIRRHIESAAIDMPDPKHPAQLTSLKEMIAPFRTWPEKEKEIVRCLDDFGEVTSAADPQLATVRAALRHAFDEARAKLNDIMAKHADAIQERVLMQRYDRFVIAVKMSRKGDFRRSIVHDVSSTGSTAYIEPASVKPLNDRLRELVAKEKARVNAVLRKLSSEIVAPIAEDVRRIGNTLAQIDAAAAKARCSYALGAVDVVFDNEKPLKLLGARHPLLVWKAMDDERYSEGGPEGESDVRRTIERSANDFANDLGDGLFKEPLWKTSVIPSSYHLNKHVRCVCVTGPNTGGKTLCLKTLGTCVLMAKAGLFVPAKAPSTFAKLTREHGLTNSEPADAELEDSATIPYFDAILADIGDDQSLVQSLSTFSGHVRRIKRILAASSPQTLVLLDEIGSGTDPAEGAALGMAILRHLAIEQRAALTFATTHHGELKTLKYSEEKFSKFFENASVEFDDVRMAPTYKLVWGIPGRSNALAIADRLGLSRNVIDEARSLLTGGCAENGGSAPRVNIEKMISSLEKEKIAAEVAREDSERRLREVEVLRSELNERVARLRESERSLRQNQKAAMEEEMKAAKKQIAKVIREMQKGGRSAQAASVASEKLGKLRLPGVIDQSQYWEEGAEDVKPVDVGELQVGDKVRVKKFGVSDAEVVEIGRREEVTVSIGGMKAKLKAKEIAGVVRRNQPRVQRDNVERSRSNVGGGGKNATLVRTSANTVDIRGERVESAEGKVEAAMDRALAMGALWVIHGHGTGRLRQGIREFLKNHELVKKMTDADQADGGTGVTVVYF